GAEPPGAPERSVPLPPPPTSLRLHRPAQACRGRARVRGDLLLAGADRAPLDRAQQRLRAADADREVGRARAAALAVTQELLDDPVLERVEADHRQPPTGAEHLERSRERVLEHAELVVDRDPE